MERARGWPLGTFIRAYEANRAAANSSAFEASPVAQAIEALVADRQAFEGTATELLNELSRDADELATNDRGWPDSGWKLSRVLRRLAPNLRASGMDVTIGGRTPDHKRVRIIRIGRSASVASDVSTIAENQPSLPSLRTSSASRWPSSLAPGHVAICACTACAAIRRRPTNKIS